MRRPTRPPPPPPIDYPGSPASSSSLSNGLQFSGTHKKSNSSKQLLGRNNYFSLSECDLGQPLSTKSLFHKSLGFKSRASTSFSSTLKSATIDSHARSNHQKSRSLTTNHFGSSYLYLDLPSSPTPFKGNMYTSNHNHQDARFAGRFGGGPNRPNNRSSSSTSSGFGSLISPTLNAGKVGSSSSPTPASIVYKTVDFLKTDALEQCKTERRKN